jgi:hypothetical protein
MDSNDHRWRFDIMNVEAIENIDNAITGETMLLKNTVVASVTTR